MWGKIKLVLKHLIQLGESFWWTGAITAVALHTGFAWAIVTMLLDDSVVMQTKDWIFAFLFLFAIVPFGYLTAFGYVRKKLGLKFLHNGKPIITGGYVEERLLRMVWAYNIFGIVLAPLALLWIIFSVFGLM